MNEMTAFLNKHFEIKTTVLIINDEYTYSALRDFINESGIRRLILAGMTEEREVNRIKEQIKEDVFLQHIKGLDSFEYIDLREFKGVEDDWCLCTIDIEPEIIKRLEIFKPKYLLSDIKEQTGIFSVWETYRDSCEHIQIKVNRENSDAQILVWDKDASNDIELSVIFPIYNVEKYIDECIKSVTKWKAPYVEFIFINDGSPDNSREIVLKWTEKDKRIRLLDKANGGCASARQFGMERARGKYIGFVDPDDFVDEEMFKKLFKAAMIGSYDISYCGYNEYYETTKERTHAEDALDEPYCSGTCDINKIRELIGYCRVAIWRGIYSRKLIEGSGIHFYTDLRRFDDLPFKIETFAAAKSVIAVPEYLYYYRLARPGQDVSADDERLYVHFDIFKHLNESIASQKNAELTDWLQVAKVQTHLYALSKIRSEYRQEYIRFAKADLNSTGEPNRCYKLILSRLGRENADKYKEIIKG